MDDRDMHFSVMFGTLMVATKDVHYPESDGTYIYIYIRPHLKTVSGNTTLTGIQL